jgi:hypothetical protein
MDDAQTQLATLQANNQADASALTALESDLSTPAVPSIGDQVLEAILPVLTAAGYTITAPSINTETSDATDSTDSTSSLS